MSATSLLHPRETSLVSRETVRAFFAGSRLSPNRAAFEFYPTPPEATRALLSVEAFAGTIWEPACGQGHVSKVLLDAGHVVVSSDLVSHGFGESGVDFLTQRQSKGTHIITNPPYGRGLADAFCKHALRLVEETGGKVAMLVAVQSLCHPIRHPFFTEHPPSVVYALDECHCWPYGDASLATPSLKQQRYCWLVWHPGRPRETSLRWLSTRALNVCPSGVRAYATTGVVI